MRAGSGRVKPKGAGLAGRTAPQKLRRPRPFLRTSCAALAPTPRKTWYLFDIKSFRAGPRLAIALRDWGERGEHDMLRLILIAPFGVLFGVVQSCGLAANGGPSTSRPANGAVSLIAPSPTVRLPSGLNVNVQRPFVSLPLQPRRSVTTAPVATAAPVLQPATRTGCIAERSPTSVASDCCTGKSVGGFCVPVPRGCSANADCPSGQACIGGACCLGSGGCFGGTECCSGQCSGDTCVCRPAGETCTQAADCCSLSCESGTCG
jgi:hypothetical protein